MRWIIRHAAFALCLTIGTTAWYILAQKRSSPAEIIQSTEEASINQPDAPLDCVQPEEAALPGQSIKFGPIEPMTGYSNGKTIILRESADASAPIVAKLKPGEYETAVILGATRDFIHVRFTANGEQYGEDGTASTRDYEGWTAWGSIVPELSAVVLDAETGAVISRVPLSEAASSVIFSPDGSKAIFFSRTDGILRAAYEVRTDDYTLTRSLTASDTEYLGQLFYGPANGDLHATVHWSDNSSQSRGRVSLIRIGEEGAPNTASEFNLSESGFAISPDGLTGFIARPESGSHDGLTIDVIDLATQKIRNTFKLAGENVPSNAGGFVLSRDGSELYERLSENTGTISVIDTRTGQIVRELPDSSTQGWSYFYQGDLIGDSLLLRVWEGDEDEMHHGPHMFWVGKSGRVEAESGIAYAVEAGVKRFAVNSDGTRLFKLDANNHILERMTITRPELHKGATNGDGLSVFGLTSSPDGKRIIMLVGIEQGC